MRRAVVWIGLVYAALAASPGHAATVDDLVRAYPDELTGVQGGMLIWRDGTHMAVDDGLAHKTFDEQLRNGSIMDQLRLDYPAGAAPGRAPVLDPGRVRNKAFFNKMYGDCHDGEVAPKLTPVVWLPHSWGRSISITSVNGVDKQLDAVSRELDALPADDKAYLYPLGGTYACRAVADTGQTSMHAWGAAIDINTARSNYWMWMRRGSAMPAYENRIPSDIVAIFERHGFIWGGRWSHFDTMHFEYRPELLVATKKGK